VPSQSAYLSGISATRRGHRTVAVFAMSRMRGIASNVSLVLDVSVAAQWFLRDENDEGAGALLTQIASLGAYVPALFHWEIQSVLIGAERARRIDPADVDAALGALRDLPIVVDSAGERVFSGSELHVARHYDLTPYDAAYLALAAGRHLPLATFDAALAHAASDRGVIVVPSAR
jgi:predicted nucleic acid-binding protein